MTSYALPPQTSFAAAPYCLYRKGNSNRTSTRFTYAAIERSSPSEKPRVVCFTEQVQKDGTSDTTKSSYTVKVATEDVVALETLPVSGTAKGSLHDVLIVFRSGNALCLSADLQEERWSADLKALAPQKSGRNSQSAVAVEYVAVTTARAAVAGLLRSRQDIAALLDPSQENDAEALNLMPVLCAITGPRGRQRTLELFQIQPRSSDLITSRVGPMKHLVGWQFGSLAPSPVAEASDCHYNMHATTGILHELSKGRFVSYDFADNVPRIHSDFSAQDLTLSSFLRLSPDLVFSASARSWSIFDMKHNSIQASSPILLEAKSPESRKRKLAEPVPESGSDDNVAALIAYFADLGIAVALLDNELLGVPISEAPRRKKAKGTLLIDSLGMGLAKSTKEGEQQQEWQKRVSKLDKYASKGKVADFEKTFAGQVGIELEQANGEAEKTSLPDGTDVDMMSVDGQENSDDQLRTWKFPKPAELQRNCHRVQALYALRKIFQLKQQIAATTARFPHWRLTVNFFPPNVFQWLLMSGFLTKESIRRSLLEASPDKLELLSTLRDGDIVNAIVEYDSDLHILSAMLNHGSFLPAGEVVQAIKVQMAGMDSTSKSEHALLTNGAEPSEDDMQAELAQELDAATQDLDHALTLLDKGLLIQSNTLRPALIRLHTFPANIITSTLRSSLSRGEMESLIRLLHAQLRNGGWTSPLNLTDSELSASEAAGDDPENQAVSIIASLLSCILDAIGGGVWLSSLRESGSDESGEAMIEDLVQDTSEALNGFWEARFMRGLLSEFLRYQTNVSKSRKPTNKSLQNQGKPFVVDVSPEDLPIMPLGGKVDMGISTTEAGGRKARSAREIGMLASKRVPKYSVERIVI